MNYAISRILIAKVNFFVAQIFLKNEMLFNENN